MESQIERECEICGCKEFTIDAGFYYCQECGTRAKELQEVQYELTQGFSSVRLKTRKIKKSSSAKSTENKLTSWEVYNYILIGLVGELQKLGASEAFKMTTLQLWTAYLSNIEVAFTSKKDPLVPKLPVTFKQTDAEILYGRMRLRRKRKISKTSIPDSSVRLDATLDHTSLDTTLVSKQRSQEKRALIEAEYEAITGTQQSDTNSVFNSSFHTVKTSSSTATSGGRIRYNKAARRECVKYMGIQHFNKHTKDENSIMKCHKRKPSEKYLKSATFVTRNCLWSILYLALNLTEDSIQLGDMIRYCREGNLSYYSLKHFVPEDYVAEEKNNAILENAKHKVPCHNQIRVVATKIANIIKIRNIKRPDFFILSSRFCKELELPLFVAESVEKLSSSNTNEIQEILSRKTGIPNYEGRVMAYILFILKLIFGLDDCTEYNISSKVKTLNLELSKIDDQFMPIFSWEDWLSFIEFRKLIVSQKHFPTKLLLDPKCDKSGGAYVDFWKKIKFYDETENTNMPHLFTIMKKVFADLIRLQEPRKPDFITFEPTLTPFKTYFQTIIENCFDYSIPGHLTSKHSEHDISFYINGSKNKINLLDKDIIVKFKKGLSNKDINIIDIDKEFHDQKDESTYKINRHEIVKVEPIGTVEWIMKKEKQSTCSPSCDDKIKEAKRKSLVVEEELNNAKSLKLQAKKDIHQIQSAKFGGSVNIKSFWDVMVERTKNPIFNNSDKFNKYESAITKPVLPSPNRNLKGKFIGGFSDYPVTKTKNQHRKWFLSPYCANPLLKQNDLRLGQQILSEIVTKPKSKESIGDIINIPRPAAQYWINHFNNNQITNIFYEKIESKFPSSFLWLLEECSRTIEMSKFDLYKELVEIEKQFGLIQFPDRNRVSVNTDI